MLVVFELCFLQNNKELHYLPNRKVKHSRSNCGRRCVIRDGIVRSKSERRVPYNFK